MDSFKIGDRVQLRSSGYTGRVTAVEAVKVTRAQDKARGGTNSGDRYGMDKFEVASYSVLWDGEGLGEGYRAEELSAVAAPMTETRHPASTMNVSKALKKAGHSPYNGTVMHPRNGGFKASIFAGTVRVTHRSGADTDRLSDDELTQLRADMNDLYAETLTRAGYTVERTPGGALTVWGVGPRKPLSPAMKAAIRTGRGDRSVECDDRTFNALLKRGLVQNHIGNLTRSGVAALAELDAEAAPAAQAVPVDYTEAVVEMMRANGGQYVWGKRPFVHCHMTTSEICAKLTREGRARMVKLGTWELTDPAVAEPVSEEHVSYRVEALRRNGRWFEWGGIETSTPEMARMAADREAEQFPGNTFRVVKVHEIRTVIS